MILKLLLLFAGVICTAEGFRRLFISNTFSQFKTQNVLSRQILYSTASPTDDVLAEWLDEMLYCGDIEGFIRRKAKDILNDDFIGFVEEQVETCEDEEEKVVMSEIIAALDDMKNNSEGILDGGLSFITRLDKILFTPPSQRRQHIESTKDEITTAFVEYVQGEMRDAEDTDSKVVLASILQVIGDVLGTDALGQNSFLLQGADASLGEQFKKSDLIEGGVDGPLGETDIGDRNEQILAALLFSQNDILEDILNNLHEINEDFVTFIEKKVDNSQDMEERVGLGSLRDTIKVVLDRVAEAEQSKDDDLPGEELTLDQVKQRMQEVQMGREMEAKAAMPGAATVFKEFGVKQTKRDTFLDVLSRFTDLPADVTLEDAVNGNYDLCDKDFMEQLQAEIEDCRTQDAAVEAERYEAVMAMINNVMAQRIGSAQERLQEILQAGSPMAMESKVAMMTRKGQMDEALLLLMQANAEQARQAGATPAADLLDKLVNRVFDERDRLLPDEQRLLRALIKIEEPEKRKELLYDAFKPNKVYDRDTNEVEEGPPLITPPAFINIVRDFITNFGNVESFKIMDRAQSIIDEAQAVATDLYGEGMNKQQQQKYMYDKRTVSVWDLANFEDQAMMSGEEVPWRNDKYDQMDPEDVLTDRVKKVGGIDDDD